MFKTEIEQTALGLVQRTSQIKSGVSKFFFGINATQDIISVRTDGGMSCSSTLDNKTPFIERNYDLEKLSSESIVMAFQNVIKSYKKKYISLGGGIGGNNREWESPVHLSYTEKSHFFFQKPAETKKFIYEIAQILEKNHHDIKDKALELSLKLSEDVMTLDKGLYNTFVLYELTLNMPVSLTSKLQEFISENSKVEELSVK